MEGMGMRQFVAGLCIALSGCLCLDVYQGPAKCITTIPVASWGRVRISHDNPLGGEARKPTARLNRQLAEAPEKPERPPNW
jgi:hypothetical protein